MRVIATVDVEADYQAPCLTLEKQLEGLLNSCY